MSIHDLAEYVTKQAALQKVTEVELSRRTKISRPALRKILRAEVKCPEILTLAKLAYALDDHPYKLVSLYLAGTSAPPREGRSTKGKKDGSRFIRDITIPDGTLVTPRQRFHKIWEIANSGEEHWLGRKLICVDQNSLLYRKVGDEFVAVNYSLIPDKAELLIPDTMPGKIIKLEVDFVAPNTSAWVTSYWKMVDRDGNLCFPELEGLRCCVSVVVI